MGLPAESKTKFLQPLLEARNDPLKHFTKEKPGWKLAALCVWVLPRAVAVGVFTWVSVTHWFK